MIVGNPGDDPQIICRPRGRPPRTGPKRRTPHPGGNHAPATDGGAEAKTLLLGWLCRNLPTGRDVRANVIAVRISAEAGELIAESAAVAAFVAGEAWPKAAAQALRRFASGERRLTPAWKARLIADLSDPAKLS